MTAKKEKKNNNFPINVCFLKTLKFIRRNKEASCENQVDRVIKLLRKAGTSNDAPKTRRSERSLIRSRGVS